MAYVTPKQAAFELGVHHNTLRRMAKENRINFILTSGNHRRYDVQSYIAKQNSHKPE